jgi:hypothetical protein
MSSELHSHKSEGQIKLQACLLTVTKINVLCACLSIFVLLRLKLAFLLKKCVGSVVGMATSYGVDSPEFDPL